MVRFSPNVSKKNRTSFAIERGAFYEAIRYSSVQIISDIYLNVSTRDNKFSVKHLYDAVFLLYFRDCFCCLMRSLVLNQIKAFVCSEKKQSATVY